MIHAAAGERQARTHQRPAVRLFVATWPEALPLLGFGPIVTGMGRDNSLFRWERARVSAPVQLALSAGFAGACQPALKPGDIVLSGEIPLEIRRQLGAASGELRTLDHIATPDEKTALGQEGVAAVDMESAWLAQAAADAGVTFQSVRVIVDRLQDPAVSLATAMNYLTACRALRRAVGALL